MFRKVASLIASLFLGFTLVVGLISILSVPTGVSHAQPAKHQPNKKVVPNLHWTTIGQQKAQAPSSTIAFDAGPYSDLAVDKMGRLHTSFINDNGDKLHYGLFSDGLWLTQTVDSGQMLRGNSIAVDDSGRPVIVYEKQYDLVYAYLDAGNWHTSTIVPGAAQSREHKQMDIAIDSLNQPNIAYSQDRQLGGYWFSSVHYARKSGGGWSFHSLDGAGEALYPPIKIALDGQDAPQVLYKKRFYGGYFDIRLQQWISQSWQLEVLEHGWYNTFPVGADLLIDDSDKAWWTYMWHGQWIGGSEQSKERLATGEHIMMSGLALDDSGQAHVVMRRGATLTLASQSDCGWVYTQLATVKPWQKSDVSLAIVDDTAHIVYHEAETGKLLHLRQPLAAEQVGIDGTRIEPSILRADGQNMATVTVGIRNCAGNNLPVSLTISPSLGAAFVQPQAGTTIEQNIYGSGELKAVLQTGTETGLVTVTASADGVTSQSTVLWLIPDQATIKILVDDFEPKIRPGDSGLCCTRLGSQRGALGDSELSISNGRVTSTIMGNDGTWGGGWLNLAHSATENEPLNFGAISPPAIKPAYQSMVTNLTLQILDGTPGRMLHIELKNDSAVLWDTEIELTGGPQSLSFPLVPLGDVTHLTWFLSSAEPGDYVVVDRIELSATTPITDTALAGFIWSYGMLLDNWDPQTGLVRDKARLASGSFDSIQSTGSLAAASVIAEQLGIIDHTSAVQIVSKISDTLLIDVPRYHGLWPHFPSLDSSGMITITPGTEWSSIDTVIATLSLHNALYALGLPTEGTEQILSTIDWLDLRLVNGISHGYAYSGTRLAGAWDTFGGESWLVALAYTASMGELPPMANPLPPTFNGSGFIDELAWLYIRPPDGLDAWGANWETYRQQAADEQLVYYPINNPSSCFSKLGLFGLSVGEVPEPANVSVFQIYQAFGVGGLIPPFDGSSLLSKPVVVPHYSPMIASFHPSQTITMWTWLQNQGLFTPLTNVESLMFESEDPACSLDQVTWNHLKGSWNLSLQTLGWGHYLLQRENKAPAIWRGTTENPYLFAGYLQLFPDAAPRLTIGNASIIEGDTGFTQVTLTTTLNITSILPVTVTFHTVDGTAIAGNDYLPLSSDLAIPSGDLSSTITLSIIGETVFEQNEDFFLILTTPINAILGNRTAVVTILADDYNIFLPMISIE